MIVVHHLEQSRSLRVLWLLEELGVDYDVRRYRRDAHTRLAPPELKEVHPLGKSPVLTDDGTVIAETGLIVEYLCDRYGDGQLSPPTAASRSSREWLEWAYWLHYAEGSAMPALLLKLVMDRVDVPALDAIRAGFVEPQVRLHLEFWEATLAGSEWFAGSRFTAADVMMSFPIEAVARLGLKDGRRHTERFLERIHDRPAYRRAVERDGLDIPD